jgi:hypothetical protein
MHPEYVFVREEKDGRSIPIKKMYGFSGQQKNPGASAAERGRPSPFKTIDEDRRERHDHINRSGRATYPGRISVLTSGATPVSAPSNWDCITTSFSSNQPSFKTCARTLSGSLV